MRISGNAESLIMMVIAQDEHEVRPPALRREQGTRSACNHLSAGKCHPQIMSIPRRLAQVLKTHDATMHPQVCLDDFRRNVRVRNLTRGVSLGDSIDVADTSSKRRTGLLKHASLPAGQGLWIVPCEAIHTFGMKFPIDVAFLSKNRRVLKVRKEMPRRRFAICMRAHSVLELPAGM